MQIIEQVSLKMSWRYKVHGRIQVSRNRSLCNFNFTFSKTI